MTVHYTDDSVTLHHGDCLDVLRELPDESVHAVVTDPPYGLGFMGRAWDTIGEDVGRGAQARVQRADEVTPTGKGHSTSAGPYLAAGVDSLRAAGAPFQRWCEAWAAECLRVLTPGGHLLAFGGSRTWHRLAAGVEDTGFEIRDSIAWLYGSGFPKSLNVGDGRGTALKPAFEPIVVGRKPLSGTVAATVLTHGTGALNIDACRTAAESRPLVVSDRRSGNEVYGDGLQGSRAVGATELGRWPTNVVLDDSQAAALDEQTGVLTSGANPTRRGGDTARGVYNDFPGQAECTPARGADSGGASRFFPTFRYKAKAPSSERPSVDGVQHPTVKPLDLMRWLVRLVTPPGGTVLEPFAGSGTTAEACVHEHRKCIAIEREAEYLPLIVSRLSKPIEIGFDFGETAS